MSHNSTAEKIIRGAVVMAAISAAFIAGSETIYQSLSRIGRPISEEPIYTPGVYTEEENGYGGPVTVTIKVTDREILSVKADGANETDGIGSKAVNQLPLMMVKRQTCNVDGISGATKSSAAVKTAAAKALAHARGEEYVEEKPAGFVTPDHMADGTYKYEQGFDGSGYNNIVTLEIKNGKVAACSWDALNQDGVYKSQLCMNGEYVMTENGPTWDEQAKALAQYVIENQSIENLADSNGYTDQVASVSINIFPFINGIKSCMMSAAGIEE